MKDKNTELKLINMLNVATDEINKQSLKKLFFKKEKITLADALEFPLEQQEELIRLAKTANQFFIKQSASKNSGNSFEKQTAIEIENFISQLDSESTK